MTDNKLREALAQKSVDDADAAAWILDESPEDVCEERMSWSELCDKAYNLAAGFVTLRNAINAAIAAPQRNCDVGTPEEQEKRFDAFCKSYKAHHGNCFGCAALRTSGDCKVSWMRMPCEEKGSEG